MSIDHLPLDKYPEHYSELLTELLNAQSIKYSIWPTNARPKLEESAGVYHFYEKSKSGCTWLYVGKGGFGKNDDWNLYKRIDQNFDPSQKNALIGNIAKKTGEEGERIRQSLRRRNVYLQWLVLHEGRDMRPDNLETELNGLRRYCISFLNPKYTEK